MRYQLLYPGFKKKAVTFSYDDGVIQDKKLIEIFNKYQVKATFNLNVGQSGKEKIRIDKYGNEIDCSHLDLKENKAIYDGHEIANHTNHHPHLETISKEEQYSEFESNIKELEKIFGRKVFGAAYPYGTFDENSIQVQQKLKIEYDRTTRSTYSFALPYNWLTWNPTIHHRDENILEYVKKFLSTNDELALLYIWGHAYEFAIDHNFDLMEEICKELKANNDIAYMTNHEIYEYANACSLTYYRYEKDINGNPLYEKFYNRGNVDVYIEVENQLLVVPKNGEITYVRK